MKLKTFSGMVIRHRVAPGSKSDHAAVCLDTGVRQVKLRREGGHAFTDPVLEKLIGKHIKGQGREIAGSTVLLSDWKVVPKG